MTAINPQCIHGVRLGDQQHLERARPLTQDTALTVWSKCAKSPVDANLELLRRSPITRSQARRKEEATLHSSSTMAEARMHRDFPRHVFENAGRLDALAQVHIDVHQTPPGPAQVFAEKLSRPLDASIRLHRFPFKSVF